MPLTLAPFRGLFSLLPHALNVLEGRWVGLPHPGEKQAPFDIVPPAGRGKKVSWQGRSSLMEETMWHDGLPLSSPTSLQLLVFFGLGRRCFLVGGVGADCCWQACIFRLQVAAAAVCFPGPFAATDLLPSLPLARPWLRQCLPGRGGVLGERRGGAPGPGSRADGGPREPAELPKSKHLSLPPLPTHFLLSNSSWRESPLLTFLSSRRRRAGRMLPSPFVSHPKWCMLVHVVKEEGNERN